METVLNLNVSFFSEDFLQRGPEFALNGSCSANTGSLTIDAIGFNAVEIIIGIGEFLGGLDLTDDIINAIRDLISTFVGGPLSRELCSMLNGLIYNLTDSFVNSAILDQTNPKFYLQEPAFEPSLETGYPPAFSTELAANLNQAPIIDLTTNFLAQFAFGLFGNQTLELLSFLTECPDEEGKDVADPNEKLRILDRLAKGAVGADSPLILAGINPTLVLMDSVLGLNLTVEGNVENYDLLQLVPSGEHSKSVCETWNRSPIHLSTWMLSCTVSILIWIHPGRDHLYWGRLTCSGLPLCFSHLFSWTTW